MEKYFYKNGSIYILDTAPNGSSHLGHECRIYVNGSIGSMHNLILCYSDNKARVLSSRIIIEKNGDVELYSPYQQNSYYLRLVKRG